MLWDGLVWAISFTLFWRGLWDIWMMCGVEWGREDSGGILGRWLAGG